MTGFVLALSVSLALPKGGGLAPKIISGEGTCWTSVRCVAEVSHQGNFALVEGDRLYYGAESELYVFDIVEPLKPRLVGKVGGIGRVRQMAIGNGLCYIAARETGVWIVDAREPAAPKVLSRFDTVELATGITVAGDVAMVGERNNGVEFIDVSNPLRPAHIRLDKTPESQHTLFRDGLCYSGEWHSGEVTILDARDMSDVRKIGVARLQGHGDGVDIQGNLLFASTGHHRHDLTGKRRNARKPDDWGFGEGHGVEIFDISNRTEPKFLGRCNFDRFYRIGMDMWMPRASGDYVFCADTYNGLYAVDATNPREMRVVGRITVPDPKRPDAPSSPVTSVAVAEGVVYLTSQMGGLVVAASPFAKARTGKVEKGPVNADYRAPYAQELSHFTAWSPKLRGQVHGVAACGDWVYVACGQAGLSILKKAASGYVFAKAIDLPFCGDVKVRGKLLYSAEALEGLAVYDVSRGDEPKELKRIRSFNLPMCSPLWLEAPAHSKDVIVSDRQNGYSIMDPTDDWKIIIRTTGCPGWDRYYSNDLLGGRYYAQSLANIGFMWIDRGVSPPKKIVSRVNRVGISDGCLAWRGGRLLLPCKDEFIFLQPGQAENADGSHWRGVLKHPKSEKGPGAGQPAWDGANRLAMTSRIDKEVWMLDMTDELQPKTLWGEKVAGNPEKGIFHQGRLLVPCGYQGLLIEKGGLR